MYKQKKTRQTGFEPARIAPIDFKSISLTTRTLARQQKSRAFPNFNIKREERISENYEFSRKKYLLLRTYLMPTPRSQLGPLQVLNHTIQYTKAFQSLV